MAIGPVVTLGFGPSASVAGVVLLGFSAPDEPPDIDIEALVSIATTITARLPMTTYVTENVSIQTTLDASLEVE